MKKAKENFIEKYLDRVWFNRWSEKIRYLLVGGFNTVAAYAIFAALYFVLNDIFKVALLYGLMLLLQNVISVNISIFTMRYFVFRSRGNLWREYRRAAKVYTLMGILNYVWLLVAHKMLHMHTLIAQPTFLIFSTIMTYILHKYFSFKKRPTDIPYV
ncbi:MAG: GtrA family protein [Proteobacteria bacterium]|nr:GtrA family protein [Pseudomonadota bacterium]